VSWPSAPPLSTDRLDLEPLTTGHAAEMVAVLADPDLYVVTGGAPPTRADLDRRYTAQSRGCSPDGTQGWLNWVLRERATGAAVGTVQATLDGAGVAEVAWVLATAAQGRGLAAEAARALVGWLPGQGITEVRAHVHPDHRASARVAAAAGLTPTDVVVDGEVRWVR
jgi:RimJ/RimL family protein N-acetyltransferase